MSIYKLLLLITGQDAGASAALRKVRGEVEGTTKDADLLTTALKGLTLAGMAIAAKGAVDLVWQLGQAGAEALRTEASFDLLAQRIGETGDSLLTTLHIAADNTVSDMELMRTTAGLLASGLQTSAEDIALAMEIARLKAQQFSISTAEAYNRLLTGTRKFSVEMLDEIGINLKAESVYKRRAEALGKVASELTDAERAEALWIAALEDGRRELEQYGGAVDDGKTKLEQAQVALANLRTEAEKRIAPIVIEVSIGVGGVGASIDDALKTWDILTILDKANRAYTAALLEGKDAQAAYNAVILEGLGGAEALARAQQELAEGELRTALAARDAADARVLAALQAENFSEVEYDLARAEQQAAIEHVRVATAAVNLAGSEQQVVAATDAATAAAERHRDALIAEIAAANDLEGALGRLEVQLYAQAGSRGAAAGFLPGDIMEMWREGGDPAAGFYQRAQDEIRELQQVQEDLADSTRLSLGRASDSWEDYRTSIRSAVEAALTPTSVTALDIGLAGIGEYVDKWDEDARRLDAIAARGFAELEAHPDWAGILKIPENVLRAGEDALKSWAQQTSEDVRNLFRPDLLVDNLDAAVRAVEEYLQQQAARETSIEMITRAAIEKGVTPEDAKMMVADMFGDTELAGETMATNVIGGMMVALEGQSVVGEFGLYLETDANKNKGVLMDAGILVWGMVELGMKEAMYSTNWPKEIAALVSPYVVKQLEEMGYFE